MKKIFYFAASVLMMCSCADSFLSEEPVGEFLPGQVESEENIEGIVHMLCWMGIMPLMRLIPVAQTGSSGMLSLTMRIKVAAVPVTRTKSI